MLLLPTVQKQTISRAWWWNPASGPKSELETSPSAPLVRGPPCLCAEPCRRTSLSTSHCAPRWPGRLRAQPIGAWSHVHSVKCTPIIHRSTSRSTCTMTSSSFRHQTLCTHALPSTHIHTLFHAHHITNSTLPVSATHSHSGWQPSTQTNLVVCQPPSCIQNSLQLPPQHRPAIS
jgi:hypothetical protein